MVNIPLTPQKWPMIALPIYGGKIEIPLFHSLDRAFQECVENGWRTPYVMVRSQDSVITRARNASLAHFMQATQCTDLVFIDGDISWEPGHFARLMSHDVDIVAGVYRSRGEPENPICRPLDSGYLEIDQANGLMALGGVGTGFFRITRGAVERMLAAYGHRWYEDKQTAPGLKIPCLFDFEYKWHSEAEFMSHYRATFNEWKALRGERPEGATEIDEFLRFIYDDQTLHLNGSGRRESEGGVYFSEDYIFCQRARAIGLTVWCDPQLIVNHMGEQVYPFRFISYLNRRHAEVYPQAAPSTEDLARALLAQEDAAA